MNNRVEAIVLVKIYIPFPNSKLAGKLSKIRWAATLGGRLRIATQGKISHTHSHSYLSVINQGFLPREGGREGVKGVWMAADSIPAVFLACTLKLILPHSGLNVSAAAT